jgi:hypothetical protein
VRHLLADGPEEQATEAADSPTSDHDQVGALGCAEQAVGRGPGGKDAVHGNVRRVSPSAVSTAWSRTWRAARSKAALSTAAAANESEQGTSQACTACTVAPRVRASSMGQRSARADDSDPSTPATIRSRTRGPRRTMSGVRTTATGHDA